MSGVIAGGRAFGRRTVLALALLGGGGLAIFLLLAIFGRAAPSGDPYASSLRRSAVGYRALIALIEVEVPVRAGRGVYPLSLSTGAPLLVLDPRPNQVARLDETLARAAAQQVPVVLVLPKWGTQENPQRPGWVGAANLRSPATALAPLLAAFMADDNAADSLRLVRPTRLKGEFESSLVAAQGLRPELPAPQLLVDDGGLLVPLVANRQGMLIARLPERPFYVVSDPDLVNVAGLGRGDNAVLAHRLLIGELEPEHWVVMEGNYGALPPSDSLWSALLRPPLSTVTLHLMLVAGLAGWAASGRFGRAGRLPSRVAPGKRALVETTARLLATVGDPRDSLARYLRLIAERAAERLGLSSPGDAGERLDRLDRIGNRRRASRSLAGLVGAVQTLPNGHAARQRRAVEVASALHTWYEEVCDGIVRDR